MKPAEKVALLTALVEGAKKELDRVKAEALLVAEVVGVKQFETAYGNVTIGQKDEAPYVSEPSKLLEFVKHNHPTEIDTSPRVRPAFVGVLLNRLAFNGDEFVDTVTGEAVPGISLAPKGDKYLTWPAGDAQRETKAEAAEWFAERSEELLTGMQRITAGESQ